MFKVTTGVTQFASDSVFLRLWKHRAQVFTQRYLNDLKNLELDENGKIKVTLDPKVEAVKNTLIYSDYIESRKLKLGYARNKAIEKSLKDDKKKRKLNELLTQPAYSVSLKYLCNEGTDTPIKKEDENGNVSDQEKMHGKSSNPIYMPYASTDQFKTVESKQDSPSGSSDALPALNEDYQRLYDAYIAAKKEAPADEKIKNLARRIYELEKKNSSGNLKAVPPDWMSAYEQFNHPDSENWESYYGTSNPRIPVSSVACGGCGALLHCQDPAIPGYLPSELFENVSTDNLKDTICQRCHFMKNYNTTLNVTVSPEQYTEILSNINLKKKKAAVILMIDLTDFPCSIWPNLTDIIGKYTPIFVVGNKVDLLPQDRPGLAFFQNIEASLIKALTDAGLKKINIKHVGLISAKSGFGVERLINKLHKLWEYKGDVYMIGCTNVGKSMLFNALLQSDYCKIQAVDLVQRATTSPWPGTTLNLLKFPILNPLRWRLYERMRRLKMEQLENQAELVFKRRELSATRNVNVATLQEHIGRTFTQLVHEKAYATHEFKRAQGRFGINENDREYKNSRWCYDTPGVIHPDQVLHLLTTEELLLTLPKKMISPRTFVFKPDQTMFLAGLGRLDLIAGPDFIRVTVFASCELPVTICPTSKADYLYKELLYSEAFAVPINDTNRLKSWPELKSKDFTVTGKDKDESAADIVLSSAGWISLAPDADMEVTVRAWTPEGRGIYMRTPALLRKSITLRGARIKSSAAYRLGRQVRI